MNNQIPTKIFTLNATQIPKGQRLWINHFITQAEAENAADEWRKNQHGAKVRVYEYHLHTICPQIPVEDK